MLRLAFFVLLAGGCASAPTSSEARVLVFSKTEGFRHASIEDGVRAFFEIGEAWGFGVEATEDAGAFTAAELEPFAAVVFLNTTGDVLDDEQQAALRAFVEGGGGWVGVHAAADTEYEWPWYGRLVGAYFESHPEVQPAVLEVVQRHPATAGVPARWARTDEWYTFRARPQGVEVLLRLDPSSVDGATVGDDHPIAWAHDVGRGRAVYTGLGHTAESYAEPAFRSHLGGAVCWAARTCSP